MKLFPRSRLGIVRKLDIQPGDRLMITFPHRLTAEQAEHAADVIRHRFRLDPDVNPVVILDEGTTAIVVRPPIPSTRKGE